MNKVTESIEETLCLIHNCIDYGINELGMTEDDFEEMSEDDFNEFFKEWKAGND